jgi:primosomal protein N''
MSDYMEYYEFYKKHWERSLSEKTSDMQKEIETLRAENARYREALERIDNECSRDDTIAWKIANDALEELK